MLSRNLIVLRRCFIEVKNVNEFKQAIKGKNGYIVQFTASWCGPCRQLSPVLYKKEEEAGNTWNVIKIDVDQAGNNQLCEKYFLEAVPTLIFFKNGEQVERTVGNLSSKALDDLIALIK